MISARTSYRLVRKELAAGMKVLSASPKSSAPVSSQADIFLDKESAASILRECDAVHASLEISVRKVGRRHRHSGGQRQTWHRNQTVSHLWDGTRPHHSGSMSQFDAGRIPDWFPSADFEPPALKRGR